MTSLNYLLSFSSYLLSLKNNNKCLTINSSPNKCLDIKSSTINSSRKHCSKCASIHNYKKVIHSHTALTCKWVHRHCNICNDTCLGYFKTHNTCDCRYKTNVVKYKNIWIAKDVYEKMCQEIYEHYYE